MSERVHVEIVSSGPDCLLCPLALEMLEMVAPQFGERLTWAVIDLSTGEGREYIREIYTRLDTKIMIPSILINGQVAFTSIPDEDGLVEAIEEGLGWL
jgi:hypothetical protein